MDAELLTPRILSSSATRAAQLGLDDATLSRCRDICGQALSGGRQVTHDALLGTFEAGGIVTGSQRGYHILWRLAQQRLICFGPRVGKSPKFVLLDGWVPEKKRFMPDEPLVELARRYFSSHGPATLQDFVLVVRPEGERREGGRSDRTAARGGNRWSHLSGVRGKSADQG